MATVSICKSGVRARDRGCSGTRLMPGSENLVLALCVWTGARRALRAQHHQVAAVAPGLVERSCPIRKTVSAVPPMDRRLAPFASEAADTNARFPILHGAINRLARQATEKNVTCDLAPITCERAPTTLIAWSRHVAIRACIPPRLRGPASATEPLLSPTAWGLSRSLN